MNNSFFRNFFLKRKSLRNSFFLLLFILFLFLIFEGCSASKSASFDNAEYYDSENIESNEQDQMNDQVGDLSDVSGDFDSTGFNPEGSPGMERRVPPAYKDLNGMSGKLKFGKKQQAPIIKQEQVEKQKEVKKKRVYSGYAKLTVKDIDQAKDDIQKYTEDIEGYVESIFENTVSIRVPVANFDQAFQWVLKQGKIEDKSIETRDVTEVYSDLRNRLDIAKKSRDRLYLLLTQTSDVKERVKILKEIGRLSEEIERMESTFSMLGQLIAFSRITVDLQQYYDNAQVKKEDIPFPWIKALNPGYASRKKLSARVNFDLGDRFALFLDGDIFSAESSEGVRFRVSTANNHPRGDAKFWQKALLFHLKELYGSSEEINLKTANDIEVSGVLFTSRDSEPYQYYVGVISEKKVIHIIEIFSPKKDKKEFETLFKVIEEGRID